MMKNYNIVMMKEKLTLKEDKPEMMREILSVKLLDSYKLT